MLFPVSDLDEVLSRSRKAFEGLRGARIFITGGTGFFGKWLIETLLHAERELRLGVEAVVVSRDPARFLPEMPELLGQDAVRLVRGDVVSLSSLRGEPLMKRPFSHVLHAATPTEARLYREQPEAMREIIVEGTRQVLDLAASGAAPSHRVRFLLTSSGAVYGKQPSEMTHVPEEYDGWPEPSDPASLYGIGKREAERLTLASVARNIDPVVARCWAFSGPGLPLDGHFAIGNFIRDGRTGGPIRVGGDGTPWRSYLYAADLAAWLWTLLVEAQPGSIYNVGSGDDLTIEQLARKVGQFYGCEVQIAGKPVPGAPASRYVPDVRRAERDLGLRAWTSVDEAIERTEQWLRSREPAQAGARP